MFPTYLAVVVIIAFLMVRVLQRNSKNISPLNYRIRSFFVGVLLANSIPHFIHGVSGENFPAPFGYLLGPGIPTVISNVIWGIINFTIAYYFYMSLNERRFEKSFRILILSGFTVTSIVLSIIFSR